MSHYATFGDNEREFIERHVSVDLAPESCICKAHQTEAKRLWADPSSTPKWKSDGSPVDVTCIIPECEVVHKLISLRLDATENIESVIGIIIVNTRNSITPVFKTLCWTLPPV